MNNSVIVTGTRTPIGKFQGGLSNFKATDLGGVAIRGALDAAGLDGSAVDYVVFGQVIQAGQGQITARQAASAAGVPMDVPAITINKVCLSGINAIHMADQMIRLGEAEIVIAGGMESMTNAPYLLPQARSGLRMGDSKVVDSMILDGLWCAFDMVHMGEGSDNVNSRLGLTREEQDEWSARSHERAAAAAKDGKFAEEITPVEVPQRKGDPVVVDADEGIRPGTTSESLSVLRPAFNKEGTITAGNASQISDGSAAVVVMSRERAEALGLDPIAEIVSYGMVAGPDSSLHSQPSRAINQALEKAGISVGDLDLIEINEAFAAVAIQSTKDLGVPEEIVNVNGGAVALGHPIGASGCRIVLTLAKELGRRGGGTGAAGICGGGGQGDAIIIRTL
ncbi:MAG: acetyl-CoA C-acetyltransferase [Acidobacteria bacterium]|nr:MAG: acetyl-CoA C-acetyltransferase [Acidobacteriota bacterium]